MTTVNDQAAFEDQVNIYTFTAPITGTYRFDLAETNAGIKFRMLMLDRFEFTVMNDYGNGDCVDLEEGETYQLQVQQYTGLGS